VREVEGGPSWLQGLLEVLWERLARPCVWEEEKGPGRKVSGEERVVLRWKMGFVILEWGAASWALGLELMVPVEVVVSGFEAEEAVEASAVAAAVVVVVAPFASAWSTPAYVQTLPAPPDRWTSV